MPTYAPTNWQNGITPANATNLNKIEAQLANVQYGFNIFAATALTTNDSISTGITKTYTCVGVGPGGGVPSGAKAVLLSYYYTSSAGNTFAAFTPHGTAYTTGNAPASDPATSTSAIGNAGAFIVPLDATGKIDVAASNGGLTGLYIYLYGYIY